MKTQALSIFTSLSLVFLCWVLLHIAQISTDCLNSPIVEKLSFQESKGDITKIPSCEITNYLRFWESSRPDSRGQKLVKRISALSQAKMLGFSSKVNPVQVLVTEKDSYAFNWQGNSLQIGWNRAKAQGFLEKSLLQEWLKRQNPMIYQDQFQAEVLSYLALGFLQDQLIVQDAFSGESIDLSEERGWLHWVLSLDDYCYSPWVAFDYQKLCYQKNQLSQKERARLASLDRVEKMALAPLVASLLWRKYRAAELSDKQIFLDGLKASLFGRGALFRQRTQELKNPQHLKRIREWVNGITSLYWSFLGFESSIGQDKWLSEKLDVLVEAPDMPFNRLAELLNLANSRPGLNIVIHRGEKIFTRSLSGLRLSPNGLESKYHLFSGCGVVKKHHLKGVTESRMMIVDFCKSNGEINWQPLAAGGWELFIAENPGMKFVGLFMPSVKKFSLWPQALRLRDKDLKKLAKKLGWKYQSWDEDLAAYRPIGVWDAISFYRQ